MDAGLRWIEGVWKAIESLVRWVLVFRATRANVTPRSEPALV